MAACVMHRSEEEEKSVYICIFYPNIQANSYEYHWHKFDMGKCKMYENALERIELKPKRGRGSVISGASVAVDSVIYFIGGNYKYKDSIGALQYGSFPFVYYSDTRFPQDGWKAAPQILFPCFFPIAAAMEGKLYVFCDSKDFGQSFNPNDNEAKWELLPLPKHSYVSKLVLLDLPRGRLLVHLTDGGLYAYKPDGVWECLNPTLDMWSPKSVVVDDVLYSHPDYGSTLLAYDLVGHEYLTCEWSSQLDPGFKVLKFHWDALFHLGNNKLCLAAYKQTEPYAVRFVKLFVHKVPSEKKVVTTAFFCGTFTPAGSHGVLVSLTL